MTSLRKNEVDTGSEESKWHKIQTSMISCSKNDYTGFKNIEYYKSILE